MSTIGTVRMRRCIKVMENSSSHALLVKCDDGKKYILKHKSNGQSPPHKGHVLIAELLCYLISKRFSLNIPNMNFVLIDQEILQTIDDPGIYALLNDSLGINIGSELLQDTAPVRTPNILKRALNDMHFQIIYGFDEYIYNLDRQPDNPNMRISKDKREVWLIDHSAAIWPLWERNGDLREPTFCSTDHILYPYLGPDFSRFAALIRNIYETTITEFIGIIPEEWFSGGMTRDYLENFLLVRRDNIQLIIRRAIHA